VVLLVLLGSGFHSVYATLTDVTRGRATAPRLGTAVHLLRASAYAAVVGSAALFVVFAREVFPAGRTAHE
jgi:hypothetical protein